MSGGELTGRHAFSVKFVKPIPPAGIRPVSQQTSWTLTDNIEPKLADDEQNMNDGTHARHPPECLFSTDDATHTSNRLIWNATMLPADSFQSTDIFNFRF